MSIVWQPHPNLNPSLIFIVQRAIDRILSAHLESPADDELFDISSETYERLQNYAFSQRFQIIIEFCEVDRRNYSCIHHKIDIKNYQKLNDHLTKTKVWIASRNSLKLKSKIANNVALSAINLLIAMLRIKHEYWEYKIRFIVMMLSSILFSMIFIKSVSQSRWRQSNWSKQIA